MADSQLFDVLLFNADGKCDRPLAANLGLSGAIALSRGWNDHRSPVSETAIVLPAGSFAQMCLDDLASQSDSNALDESDDSEAEHDSENAAESNVVDEICERRAKFVQKELRRHLKRIWNAVPHVTDGADLGIVAASLESVARAVDGVPEDEITHERFAYALHGDMRYTELEEALGVVR